MLLARVRGQTVLAEPGKRASCPDCGATVIAKCGTLVIWHWAHEAHPLTACSNSGETLWHLAWKQYAFERGCEVEVPLTPGFRADIVTPEGHVIELQTKPLDQETLQARENAYGHRLRWIFRVTQEQYAQFLWTKKLDNGAQGFRWRRGPKRISLPKTTVYLDIDDGPLWRAKFTLIDVDTEWGQNERLMGQLWPATESEIFGNPKPQPTKPRTVAAPAWYVAHCKAMSAAVWRKQVTENEATRDLQVTHAAALSDNWLTP